jgi:hypothetical protein
VGQITIPAFSILVFLLFICLVLSIMIEKLKSLTEFYRLQYALERILVPNTPVL